MEYFSLIVFMAWLAEAANPPSRTDIAELRNIAYSLSLEV